MLGKLLTELTQDAPMSVSDYVRLCLYHPEYGYYVKDKTRVGACGDFYTSSSLKGGVFSKLLLACAQKLHPENFDIVEVGAEPGRNLFEKSKVIRLGQDMLLEGGIFLFSNELLDAQPFDRFKFEGGKIYKTFVKFDAAGGHELSYENASDLEHACLKGYLDFGHEIFYLDFSFDALALLKNICAQSWRGVLIFADYFRTRSELADFPNGTARIYRKHRTGKNIFENPGDADITFSPAYEDFVEILNRSGFDKASCETQANFFFKNASDEMKRIIESCGMLSDEKRALSELVSPAHLGENFRILSAVRF